MAFDRVDLGISVLDAGAERPDLAARQESKFRVDSHDVPSLRRVLERTCRRISYAGPVSTVRSIYFDDARLSTCRANLDGVGIRHKTRVRWYDAEFPQKDLFLEIKWRRHRVCGKKRVHLGASGFDRGARLRAFHAELLRNAPPAHAPILAHDSEPIVLVEYQREHFATEDGRARLTLDYGLRFYPQLGRTRLSRRFPERRPDVALIECKTAVGDRAALQGVLSALRVRQTRFSKYVAGCLALGYVAEDQ